MNWYILAAGLLALLVGLVHSVLGERLVFRHMRQTGFIPTYGGPLLRERQVRILWASWHLVTIMGWSLGATLIWLAQPAAHVLAASPIPMFIAAAMLASSAVVFVGTKGKHLGWAGLLGVAILIGLGLRA